MLYTVVQPMPDLADYITTEEAAKTLGLHVETVRLFLRYKKLAGLKVGRTWLVSIQAVKEYQEKIMGKDKHDPTRKKE
jgi:excisionase family DNA binding protein